jgi:hypothetical protein
VARCIGEIARGRVLVGKTKKQAVRTQFWSGCVNVSARDREDMWGEVGVIVIVVARYVGEIVRGAGFGR